ncbi:hypothetical protein AB0H88_13250 [Nonomuraea sp. NPDC050680]|uniref:hypothetical protein n=1 Tax=Nonomuraea sp. NPDC050680 TaxID=3154630 RepID=UPI00340CF544
MTASMYVIVLMVNASYAAIRAAISSTMAGSVSAKRCASPSTPASRAMIASRAVIVCAMVLSPAACAASTRTAASSGLSTGRRMPPEEPSSTAIFG